MSESSYYECCGGIGAHTRLCTRFVRAEHCLAEVMRKQSHIHPFRLLGSHLAELKIAIRDYEEAHAALKEELEMTGTDRTINEELESILVMANRIENGSPEPSPSTRAILLLARTLITLQRPR